MKALFLTPIEENKKQQFLDTGITCIFKEKKSVTKEDFKDIDIVFGNPDLNMIKDTSVQWIQLDSAGANAYCSIPDSIVLTNAKEHTTKPSVNTCLHAHLRYIKIYLHMKKLPKNTNGPT